MIAVGYSLSLRTNYPLAAVVQTMAFPLWILLFNLKDLKRERAYGFTWLFLLIAFLEYFVLCETGTRKDHGNLSWGYCFAIFAVFVASAAKVFANFRDKTHPKPRWYYGVAGALLLLHLFFGSWYFSIIFRGGEFF